MLLRELCDVSVKQEELTQILSAGQIELDRLPSLQRKKVLMHLLLEEMLIVFKQRQRCEKGSGGLKLTLKYGASQVTRVIHCFMGINVSAGTGTRLR